MSLQNLLRRLERLPMLRALLPFAAGIALADRYALPCSFVWSGFLLCGSIALLRRSSLHTVATLLLFGWGLHDLHEVPAEPLPHGVRTGFALTAGDEGSGRITAWREPQTERWREARAEVILRTDSALRLCAGEQILFNGYLNDFPEALSAYGELMRRRGYAGTVWLSERQILERKPPSGTVSLHTAAVERLRRLGLADESQALCEAMAAGERSGLSRQLREAYARSGTAHLLAVSGLHVGIVFLLVNFLLGWMPALRRGHLWRNGAAIVSIWLYAATAGLSPSVVRAALMCSALQLSLASASVYASGNVLAAAAFGMLLWNPAWLFDLSFQLSFVAVAAILAWGVPLCRRLHTRFRPLDALTDLFAAGLAASVATAPLAAHTFGYVALSGLTINPAVIPLAAVAVFGSVIWMIAPFACAAPLFRWMLETATSWQNSLVEWAAGVPWAIVPWKPSSGATAAVYLLFAGITAAAWCVESKKRVSLPR